MIKQPDRFKNDPDELARLTALANGKAPDHISRSTFHLAELLYEAGRFADALARFSAFIKESPQWLCYALYSYDAPNITRPVTYVQTSQFWQTVAPAGKPLRPSIHWPVPWPLGSLRT